METNIETFNLVQMNVHDEVEPRKVLKKFGSEKSPIHFCQVLNKEFLPLLWKGSKTTRGARMDVYIFIYVFEIISQFCATPLIYTYVYEKENSLDRDRHQQKMVRRSIQR